MLLHKYQEMDYDEIAGILQCSESALKSLLFRAYETLRVELASLVETRRAESWPKTQSRSGEMRS